MRVRVQVVRFYIFGCERRCDMALPPLEMRGPRLGRASRPAASPGAARPGLPLPGGAPVELRGAMV
jgi:hypothetical protein